MVHCETARDFDVGRRDSPRKSVSVNKGEGVVKDEDLPSLLSRNANTTDHNSKQLGHRKHLIHFARLCIRCSLR
jgi:hypothetical protein